MTRIRKRLTYANVVATLALFLALGGVSYAAIKLPKNSVGTKQLKKAAVTGAKVKPGSLPGSVLRAGSVPATAIAPGTLPDLSGYATRAELAGRLGPTVVVNKTIAAPLAPETSAIAKVSCPPGYQAIAGGTDSSNILAGKVSASAPLINGSLAELAPDGLSGPATGWYGAVTTKGSGGVGSDVVKVQVICSQLG